MDANGTRFHLLRGESDWGACRLDSLTGSRLRDVWNAEDAPGAAIAWDRARSELRLARRARLFAQPGSGHPPRLRDRRGAARDRYGTWYWIAPGETEIVARPAGSTTPGRFWSAGSDRCAPPREPGAFAPPAPEPAPRPLRLRGLTITEDHVLVAGTLGPGGLLVFDLHAGRPPVHHVWPIPWAPFDLSPRRGGGLWALEWPNLAAPVPTWIWELDRDLRVVPPVEPAVAPRAGAFEPGPAGGEHPARNRPVSRDDARQHRGQYPVAIEGLRDGSVLVVDSVPGELSSTIWRYARDTVGSTPLVTREDLARVIRAEDLDHFTLLAADAAVVPGDREQPAVSDRLHVVASGGNQAFELELEYGGGQLRAKLADRYLPIRLFGGKALVATTDPLPSYDLGDRWLPLVEQSRPLYVASGTIVSPFDGDGEDGAGLLPAFDGGVPDCTWHRLMLDACIPLGTAVTIESQAVNDLADAVDDAAHWFPEPAPYLRRSGSELPFQPARTTPGDGTWELLFQRARGRYLLLRLTLRGTGTSTPRIRALRAWYPRFSWLEHYLPAIYRDDADSAHFLDRFLANLEGIATGIEDRIAGVQALFNARSAPPETLAWLAGWFDLVLDPTWEEPRRRLLIAHAMELFQWRGTLRGLTMALHLALDSRPGPELFTPAVATGWPRRPAPFRITESFLRRSGAAGIDDAPVAAEAPPGAPELARWQAFLERRYRRIEAVNRAHQRYGSREWRSFAEITVPAEGEDGGALARDWQEFRRFVVEAGRLAHRFTVVLPARDETPDERQNRIARVRRVIELEKPAHAVFDVWFSWSAFRVGQARLGDDTLLERGARSAFAMQPLVLNRSGLAQSYLASARDQARADGRQIVGEGNLGP